MSSWPNCGRCMPHEAHWWYDDRGESRRDCGGCTEEQSERLLREELR